MRRRPKRRHGQAQCRLSAQQEPVTPRPSSRLLEKVAITAADGCNLYYERTGSEPPVVLIPGLGGDGRFWDGVVARLADRFDSIVVDHRGAGRSAQPPGA